MKTRGQAAYERLQELIRQEIEEDHDFRGKHAVFEKGFSDLLKPVRCAWEILAYEIAMSVTVAEAKGNEVAQKSSKLSAAGWETRLANATSGLLVGGVAAVEVGDDEDWEGTVD